MIWFGNGNDVTDLELLFSVLDLEKTVEVNWGLSRVGQTGELGVLPFRNAVSILLVESLN